MPLGVSDIFHYHPTGMVRLQAIKPNSYLLYLQLSNTNFDLCCTREQFPKNLIPKLLKPASYGMLVIFFDKL